MSDKKLSKVQELQGELGSINGNTMQALNIASLIVSIARAVVEEETATLAEFIDSLKGEDFDRLKEQVKQLHYKENEDTKNLHGSIYETNRRVKVLEDSVYKIDARVEKLEKEPRMVWSGFRRARPSFCCDKSASFEGKGIMFDLGVAGYSYCPFCGAKQ